MDNPTKLPQEILDKKDLFLQELVEFTSQPSIANQNMGMDEMAKKVDERLTKLGAKTQILTVGKSFPNIYAEIGEGDKTMLIYNHYDVQPADNLELWESEPFKPEFRDGKLFARGSADNKGNLLLRIQAVELYLEKFKKLPIKIKWIIEGEEEIGSPHLHDLSDEYGHMWNDADLCIWETGGVDEDGNPATVLGWKGISYLELSCEMGERDLHSGNATLADSAVWRLLHALTTLRDVEGNVTIPELTKSIKQPTQKEIELMKKEPWDKSKALESLGRTEFLKGSADKEEVLKQHYFNGSCNICSIKGGFMEEGIKTVLPNKASAKIDLRLVMDQDSSKVADIVREHLISNGFDDIQVNELIHEPVAKGSIDNETLQKAIESVENSYGRSMNVKVTSGGSGPAYHVASKYDIPILEVGGNYPETKAHAPNENIRVDDYFNGMHAFMNLIGDFGK